jgi:hypothetical protein
MANVWGTIKDAGQWVVMTGLDILDSKRRVSRQFNTDHSKEFRLKYPVGDSIKIPMPGVHAIRNGLEYNPPANAEKFATITIGEPFGYDLPEIDSIEAALSSPRSRSAFEKKYIEPAMAKLATEIDSRCALYAYMHAAGVVGALGTDPTSMDSTTAAAKQYMDELAAPEDDRIMLLPSKAMRSLKTANVALFNPSAEISKEFKEGSIGRADGFDLFPAQSLYQHTAATWQGSVIVASAPANGATTLTLTVTSGDTFKKGDKLNITGVYPVHPVTKRRFGTALRQFTVVSDSATISGTSATITVSPAIYYEGPFQNVDSQPAASAPLTLWPGTTSPNGKVGMLGLALPQNAFALVGLDLEEFTNMETCKTMRDTDSGMSLRFMADGDARSSKRIRRFDCCIGFGELYSDTALVVACG